jgi:hypothetical protein
MASIQVGPFEIADKLKGDEKAEGSRGSERTSLPVGFVIEEPQLIDHSLLRLCH